MAKYLGVDLGAKKCGISLGNDITLTASPLTTLFAPCFEHFADKLQSLCKAYGATVVVMGDPTLTHGPGHPLESTIVALKKDYEEKKSLLSYELVWIEESYTSQLANAYVQEHEKHSRDAFAAMLILESFFSQYKKTF